MATKTLTLNEITKLIEGELTGDKDIVIRGVAGIKEAGEGEITFLANPKYEPLLEISAASAIIISKTLAKKISRAVIRVENPSLAFAKVVSFMFGDQRRLPQGVHQTAVVGQNVSLGRGVALGAYVVVEDNAEIKDGAVICAGAFIGYGAKIGADTLIYPNVTIREGSVIGSRVIIHSGTVIGSDGFGFEAVNDRRQKIPQVGIVAVEDDVEIGACVTIDRARFGKTLIGRGTKIDNLVQIAHNVVVGENSVIISQAGISGSSRLGKNVILAGQSGIVGHIEIGDNAIVGAQAGVTKSVPSNTFVVGSPAKPHNISKKIFAGWAKLPELIKEVADLKAELAGLTKARGKGGKSKDNKK